MRGWTTVRRPSGACVAVFAVLLGGPVATALWARQDVPPASAVSDRGRADDPEKARKEAEEAVARMMKAYRDERGVQVAMSVTVAARNGQGEGGAPPVTAKALFSSDRRAHLAFREWQLRYASGRVVATHDSNPLAYLDASDNGSPYYSLLNAFQWALPFPELALALGEDEIGDVCMQLFPQTPDVVPVSVGDAEFEGQACRELRLASDDASQELRLMFDPESFLLEAAVAVLRNDRLVEEGAELQWTVRSQARRPAKPPEPSAFTLDVTGKQKVDGLAALVSRDRAAAQDRDVAGLKAGEPAPAIALPKLGGGNWTLSDLRGKPVLVDFWATWCGPCKAAMPGLADLASEFEGKVEVMLVNAGEQTPPPEREAAIRGVFKQLNIELPCVLDLDGSVARKWLVRAFPTTFVIDADGRIAGVWEGTTPRSEREIRELLGRLAGEAAPAEAGDGGAPPK